MVEYMNYYSHKLGHDVTIEITGHWGYPVIMFPTSQGQVSQNRDFYLNASVNHLVEQGKIKLYNVQSFDAHNVYNKGIHGGDRIHRYEMYQQFLISEFVPYIQNLHKSHRVAVAGASFGGYHAANFAFRFPDVTSHLISLSGNFTIRNFIGHPDDDRVYYNCPEEFMPNEEAWRYQHMQIALGTSDQDILLGANQNFAKILDSKGIRYWFNEKKWTPHDWPLWRMLFPEFMNAYFG